MRDFLVLDLPVQHVMPVLKQSLLVLTLVQFCGENALR
jgi:hypothetical protein